MESCQQQVFLKGFLALFLSIGWLSRDGGTYSLLYSLADSVMFFFPIMIGYTAAKKFDLNIFTGMTIGATLVYPTIGTIVSGKTFILYFHRYNISIICIY